MTDHPLDPLDGCVCARIVQLENVLGAVAHQLGATMLPSISTDSEMTNVRSFKRLAIQTQMLADHLRHQKLALDFLRGKQRGDLDDMPGDLWQEWVVPILQGLMTKGQTLVFGGQVTSPVALPLSHAISTAMIAVDEQMSEAGEVHLWLRRDGGEEAIEIRFGAPMDDLVLAAPNVVIEAWGGAKAKVVIEPGSLLISGAMG